MLRIGLVGAGVIARDHLVALKEVEGARVVAVADVALERAQAQQLDAGDLHRIVSPG